MRPSLCLLSVSLISFASVVQLASSSTRFILAIPFPLGLHRNQSLIFCLYVLQAMSVNRLLSRTNLWTQTRIRGMWLTEARWPSYAWLTMDGATAATLIAPTARTPTTNVHVPQTPARPREPSPAPTEIGLGPATSNAPVRHCLTGHLVYFETSCFISLLMLSSTQSATMYTSIAIWCNFSV